MDSIGSPHHDQMLRHRRTEVHSPVIHTSSLCGETVASPFARLVGTDMPSNYANFIARKKSI
jgi:hypothetical protein